MKRNDSSTRIGRVFLNDELLEGYLKTKEVYEQNPQMQTRHMPPRHIAATIMTSRPPVD